jgi:hypothetical protein
MARGTASIGLTSPSCVHLESFRGVSVARRDEALVEEREVIHRVRRVVGGKREVERAAKCSS